MMEKALRLIQPVLAIFNRREESSPQIKILDLYIIREVLIPLIYSLGSFIVLYVVYDLSIHFSDFFEKGIKFSALLHYYVSSIPFIFVNATPVAVLMASLYCLGQMGKNNEITAFQASGVGLMRISAPFAVIGLSMSLLVLVTNETLVPKSIEVSQNLRQEEIKQEEAKEKKEWKEFAYKSPYSGRSWVGAYDPDEKVLKKAVIREFRPDGSLKMKYSADSIRWVEDGWWMFNGNLALFDLESKQIGSEDFTKKPLRSAAESYESPVDFENSRKETTLMNIADLKTHLKIHDKSEKIYHSELVDLHYKIAFPFISLVVIFLGVPLGLMNSGKRGSGALAGFGISLCLCLAYYAFTMVVLATGKSGALPAWFAAWLPNIVFIGIGVFFGYKIFKR